MENNEIDGLLSERGLDEDDIKLIKISMDLAGYRTKDSGGLDLPKIDKFLDGLLADCTICITKEQAYRMMVSGIKRLRSELTKYTLPKVTVEEINEILNKFNYYMGYVGVGNHIPSNDGNYKHIAQTIADYLNGKRK